MAPQMQEQPQRQEEEHESSEALESAVELAPASHNQLDDLNDLLDDIDAVLEDNAQAFVQGFVQKGGE